MSPTMESGIPAGLVPPSSQATVSKMIEQAKVITLAMEAIRILMSPYHPERRTQYGQTDKAQRPNHTFILSAVRIAQNEGPNRLYSVKKMVSFFHSS
jgi:hypothetical protein